MHETAAATAFLRHATATSVSAKWKPSRHCTVLWPALRLRLDRLRLHCDCRAYSKFLKQKLHTFEKCKYEYDKETEWAADSVSRMNK